MTKRLLACCIAPLVGLATMASVSTAFVSGVKADDCILSGEFSAQELRVQTPRGLRLQPLEREPVEANSIGIDIYFIRSTRRPELHGIYRGAVPVLTRRPLRFDDGSATVPTGAVVHRLREHLGVLVGDVSIAPGVTLSRVNLRCEDLMLAEPGPASNLLAPLPTAPRFRARVHRLSLRRGPRDDRSLHLFLSNPENFVMIELARERHFVHVRWNGPGGGILEGWIDENALLPSSPR